MVIAQIRKNENLRFIWLIDFVPSVSFGTSFSSEYASHLSPNLSSISCQNREKFEPLLLAYLNR